MVILILKMLMLAIQCILNLWKGLDYTLCNTGATAALYSKMYLFGMTLVELS